MRPNRKVLTIVHPEAGEATCLAKALPVWLERGWTAKDD